jgi:hypothetical protein
MDIQRGVGGKHVMPMGFEDDRVVGSDKYEDITYNSGYLAVFKPISKEEVESMIVDIDRQEGIDMIMSRKHGVMGVETGKEGEYWESVRPNVLANQIARLMNEDSESVDTYKVVRLTDNGETIYDPMGDFHTSGHRSRKF